MFRFGKEEIAAASRVMENGTLFKVNGGTKEVYHFEEELKAKMGIKYAICMTSGKAALISALIGMGVGPGDEVIVPAYTYIATAIAVLATGAIPVIADADATLTLDPDDVERKISKYTKVILPVHIQGFPSNMDRLTAIAKKYSLMILEDACQSDGGSYHGKRLGTIGDAGAYSFNFFKVITAGEGGALVTNNRQIFERGLIYHDSSAIAYFGNQLESIEEEQFCGSEFRVSDITGAILRAQLEKLDPILTDLHKNRDEVMSRLADKYTFAPSNDREGDCATTIPFRFDTAEEAIAFKAKSDEAGFAGTRPIDTGKHVYTNWTPVMNKRGAFHPLMDPYKMEANRELNHNYTMDMCRQTLDYLARTVYIGVSPNWNEERIDALVKALS